MSRFTLRINTENEAFHNEDAGESVHDPNNEVARIIKVVARKLEMGSTDGVCIDANGNKVGEWSL